MAARSDIHHGEPHPAAGPSDAGEGHDFICRRHLLRRTSRRKSRVRRAALTVSAVLASFLIVTVLVGAYVFVRLRQGPIAFDLKPQILAALNGRVGSDYRFDFGSTAVEATDDGAALTLDRLSVSDSSGRPIITAPQAAIAVNPFALMVGQVAPTRLDIHDVDLRLLVLPDGQVAVSAGSDDAAALPLARAFADTAPTSPPSSGTTSGASETASSSPAVVSAPPAPDNAALKALSATMRTLVDTATASDSPLNALQHVSVTGRLVLDDRTHASKTTFKNAVLGFDREADGAAVLTVSADGPAGRWTLKARAAVGADGMRTLAVEAKDLSLDEITLAGGLQGVGFDFDMPVSAKVSVALGADGGIERVGGTFDLGSGYFRLNDPDYEPTMIDGITGAFHMDRATKGIEIDKTVLRAAGTNFVATGHVDPPHTADEPWTSRIEASGVFGAERPGEKPIPISHASIAFRVFPTAHRVLIDKAQATGPDVDFDSTAEISANGPDIRIRNVAKVKHMPAQILARLWPSLLAAPARAWVLANVKGGTVNEGTAVSDIDGNDLKLIHQERSVADDHLRVTFDVSNLSLDVMAGVPPLEGVAASGVVTGHTFAMNVQHGDMDASSGRRLTLADGIFRIPDNDVKPMPATVQAHVVGGVDAIADLLSRDALKSYASLPLDPATVKGQFDGHLTLGFKIDVDKSAPPDDPKVAVDGTATNLGIDKLFGKEGLTDATVKLDLDKGALHAKGEGRVLGAPASLELRKPAGGAGEAVVALTLDDAARARAGLNAGGVLKGAVAARITAPVVASGGKVKAAVDLDFAKAVIDGPVPGFSKPMGKPAKASLTIVSRDGGISLDDIAFDAGAASLRGSADLTKDGDFASAKLSQVKLSPGDEMKVDVQQGGGDVLKVVARGANLDARPFLKWLSAPASGSTEPAKGALDLDLRSGILTGQNGQAMTGADVHIMRRAGRLMRVSLSGRLGRQPITISTAQIDDTPHFLVNADDAGTTLLFLDLYKRMSGGKLDANLVMRGSRLDGYVTVHEFTLREDPAIRKLAVEGLASQKRDTAEADQTSATVDPSAMHFTKLEASFSKTGNDIQVRDGSMFGPTLGATVAGKIDFARDQVNLGGTFVPLFGVNNLFSQVPVFGPLLGGGKHEGLVGLSYRITGSAANPVLNVNLMSALAPGFLRQIFGALDPTAQLGGSGPRDRADGPLPSPPPVE